MTVRADAGQCVSSGMCSFAVPEVFDQNDDDGAVVVLQENPSPEHHEAVRNAVQECPAQALSAEE